MKARSGWPARDWRPIASGNIYFLDGNGTFDTTLNSNGFPINGDYGNAFIKLTNSSGTLQVADYFNMYNTVQESGADERPRLRRRAGAARPI